MGENTKIEWCDATFNPWIAKRYGKAQWGPNGTRVRTSDAYWRKPLKWNRDAQGASERPRVFCASLADVFEHWAGPIYGAKGERLFAAGPHMQGILTLAEIWDAKSYGAGGGPRRYKFRLGRLLLVYAGGAGAVTREE